MKQNTIKYWCYRCKKYTNYVTTSTTGCYFYNKCRQDKEKKIKEYKKLEYSVGDKIKFLEDKKPYKIQACNENYIIVTKPFNLKHTFLYVIVDFKNCVRGADNYKCFHNYEDPKEAAEAIEELEKGELEVSYRNYCELNIERIIRG